MNSLRTRHIAALIGRILLSCVFLVSAYAKITEWSASEHMMAAKGIPAVPLALGLAVLIELLGGLSVLTGLYSRASAIVMFLYLIPVTLTFHDFWAMAPAMRSIQLVNFLKNLAIMGGLLQLYSFGPGRYSFGHERGDDREADKARTRTEAPTAIAFR